MFANYNERLGMICTKILVKVSTSMSLSEVNLTDNPCFPSNFGMNLNDVAAIDFALIFL